MAQVVYRGFYDDVLAGAVTAAADLRGMLVMSNTTTDVDEDAAHISEFTTLDECDGVGYVELDLGSITAAYDTATDRLVIDAADGDFEAGSIGACTRTVTRLLVKRYVDGTAAGDVPWFSIDIGPYAPAGGTFDVVWNATGVVYIGSA